MWGNINALYASVCKFARSYSYLAMFPAGWKLAIGIVDGPTSHSTLIYRQATIALTLAGPRARANQCPCI